MNLPGSLGLLYTETPSGLIVPRSAVEPPPATTVQQQAQQTVVKEFGRFMKKGAKKRARREALHNMRVTASAGKRK